MRWGLHAMTGVSLRGGEDTRTCTQKTEGHVDMEAEIEVK